MKNRSDVKNILSLTLAGKVQTFENLSKSEAAANAASLAARMARTWETVFSYGERLRADKSRPAIESEGLLATFAQRQVAALSPTIQSAMARLAERGQIAQGRIDALHIERDALSVAQNQEIRQYIRSLPALERGQALMEAAFAKAASCGPARLSGISDVEQQQLRQAVAARELPDAVAELADLSVATDMLKMASEALLSNTTAYTDHEVVGTRADAPASIDQYAA